MDDLHELTDAANEDARNGFPSARVVLLDLGAKFLREDGVLDPTEAEIEQHFATLQEQHEFEEYLLLSGEDC